MGFTLDSVIKGQEKKPPIIVFYGPQGVGKTEWASQAPNPIFIPREDGIGTLDYHRFSKPGNFDNILEAIVSLGSGDHNFKTLVLDTVSGAEKIVHGDIRKEHGDKIFTSFGKGHTHAVGYFDKLTTYLGRLRDSKGMMIILLAHCDVKRWEPPDSDPYDMYTIRCHDKIQHKIHDWADIVFFANFQTKVTKQEGDFGKERSVAVGDDSRVIYTRRRPAFLAKNRYDLPFEMPFPRKWYWDKFMAELDKKFVDAPPPEEAGTGGFKTEGALAPAPEHDSETVTESEKE